MTGDVEETIAALRDRFGVETDADLARQLRVDKSTVSNWRSRGRVPDRFRKILEGFDAGILDAPPTRWTKDEMRAFALALFRFTHAVRDVADGDYQTALRVFSKPAAFFPLMSEAQRDLNRRQKEGDYTLETAFALVLHDEMQEPEAAAERVRDRLRRLGLTEL